MNRFHYLFAAITALLLTTQTGRSQSALVNPGGYTNAFGTQPTAAEWGSASRAGTSTDVYDMDADVNATISASIVTNRTTASAQNPPGSLAQAGWSSTGLYLQTRPTGGRYTVLMGKFVNNTGTNATQFTVSYLHTIAGNPALEDTNKGLRVYYSLTGETNGWTNLETFNTTATNGSFNLSTNLSLNWPYRSNLFLLWVDDNATPPTDVANQFDNFSLQVLAGAAPTVVGILDSPTNNAVFFSDAVITGAVRVFNGTPPYVVQFFTNSGVGNTTFQSAGSVTTSPYNLNLGPLPTGTYHLYATVSDENGAGNTTNTVTNTFSVVDAIVRLTSPTNGQFAPLGQTLLLSATAAVGATLSVSNVEFFYDGISAGTDQTAPYSVLSTNLVEGFHTVYAAATDGLGRVTYSTTNQISIAVDPLGNNNFANRYTLGTPASVTGNNTGANNEGGETTFQFGGGQPTIIWGATLWYRWVAPFNGTATIDTFGSSINTVLSVYTGTTVGGLSLVARNDNADGSSTASLVAFPAVAGTEYQVQLGGQGGFGSQPAQGPFQLHVSMPPAVAITNPAVGSAYLVGDNILVEATAFSGAGAITNVSLYRGATFLGSATAPPYSFVVSNAPAGTNAFYAVGIDSIGQVGTSAVVRVLVANIGITITSPVDGDIFGNTNPLPVSVYTALPSGSITEVNFFVDGQAIGQATAAPFTVTWSNVVSGSHRLTANGRDDSGNFYAATPVNIGVGSVLIASNSVWKYLDDGTDQGTNWISPSFADSTWAEGPAPLGYSDSNGRLPLTTTSFGTNANNKIVTTYFRHSFQASGGVGLTNLVLNLQRDDGAIVYLNGAELGRFNMPTGAVNYTTFSPSTATDDGGTTVTFNVSPGLLRDGVNVMAVEIHQDSPNSSDIWFVMELLGVPVINRNESPIVAITSPTNSAVFVAPVSIALEAAASDADGSVSLVEFFADGVKVAESTNAPYSASWFNPAVGPHALYAVATDNQGGSQRSATVNIVVFDAARNPVVAITSPTNNTVVEGPTNMVVTAFASAFDSVANVEFFANGSPIGNDSTSPYSVLWNAPFGVNELRAIVSGADGKRGTSAIVNVTITIPPTNTVAPTIFRQIPLAFTDVTNANFTNITVIFSERVQNVDASDLLVNAMPATSVTGSGSNYIFGFPKQPYGEIEIVFAGGHGITDFGYPTNLPFDELGETAAWEYEYLDVVAPTIAARSPAAGTTVTNLTMVSVTFSEPVTGVSAEDLLVNGTPAFALTGSGADYVFNVIQPASGTVNVTWATNHGIADLGFTGPPIPFNRSGPGATWSFTLDSRTTFVQSNSTWRFIRGLAEASDPSSAWRQLAFDDSGWSNGRAPFVFGEPTFTNALNPGTVLNDMASNAYSSVYLRQPFVVASLNSITNLLLRHQSDDGFIAWINGVEIFRFNMPTGAIPFNGSAAANANEQNNNGAAYITATLPNAVSALVVGTNILAVHAFNVVTNPPSSDFVFNAQLYTFITDPSIAPPRVVSADPAPGDVFSLTNVTVTFSEGVANVEASDLLVNGVPATAVSSSTNTVYTFTFPQPAYGPVLVTWATNHGIVDFDEPPKPFNANLSSSRFSYALVNPSAPTIISQIPLGGSTITGLTSIAVTFSEPVVGVDAGDLLVNGAPVVSVVGSGSNYTFTVTQPVYGIVAVRWATNIGIQDLEVPANDFDGTRPGNQWNYALVNPVPTVTMTSPTNGAYMLAPANVPLRATATDNDGTIVQVEYYEYYEGQTVGVSTEAPYSIIWSNVPLGTFTLRAIATDDSGLRGTSAPVVIRVVTEIPAQLVRGPYLQIGTPSGGVVRWRTDQIADSLVRYGTSLSALTNVAVGTPTNTEHVVQISGLQPDTKYFYSIGSSNQTLVGGTSGLGDGSNYWFITSPVVGTPKPTRIWVLGDAGTAGTGSPDRQRSTRDAFYNFAAISRPADIWMMLGDNAYNSGTDSEHQVAVFDMYPETLRNLFLWPTLGNHETSQSTTATEFPYLDIFTLPQNGEAGGVPSGTEKYYSFDYANIHFVCLDSMTSGRTTNTAMARWLINDLENAVQPWTIVFFHHPPYTKGSHDSDAESDLAEIRSNLVPILERYGVDLVLSGHSHCYERSFLLHGQYGPSSSINATNKLDPGDGREDGTGVYMKTPAQKGVVYTVAGSSGQATGGQLNHPAHFISLNQLGTMVIDVVSNRLDGIFLTSTGTTNDHFTLIKREPVFAPIAVNINGEGTVSGVTNGQVLLVGETYTAVAMPAPGFIFVNWTGSVSNNSATLNFVMESNLVLTANFAVYTGPQPDDLTLTINGNGTVTGATNGQFLNIGQNYTLVATPAAGWVFVNWSGDVSETSSTLNFVMSSNLVIVANFAPDTTPQTARLTLVVNGNGTVAGAVNGQLLEIGQGYTLTANPNSGWVFANWSGGVSGNSSTLNFIMRSNLVIVANFVEQGGGGFQPDQLTLVINGEGTVAGATNGQVLQLGSNYTLVATPAAGWVFANWSGGVSGTSPTLDFLMQSNLVIVANFVEQGGTNFQPDQLTLVIEGSGTVAGATNGQVLQIGNNYTLVATPAAGWVFVNWSGGVSETSSTLNFIMSSNLVIVANFAPAPAPITARLTLVVNGNGAVGGAVNGQLLEIGQSYTLTATPAGGWIFANWSGGVSGNSQTLNFIMRSNLVIVANFVEQGGGGFQPDQLTLVINGDGTVAGATNGQSLQIGASYTLVATPAAGWVFANWSGGVAESSPTLNFLMQSNLVIVANFVEQGGTNFQSDQLTLVIEGGGTVAGATNGQVLQIGNSYTLVATADDGWVFANWSGGVSEASPTLTFTMRSNLVIVANFVPEGTNAPFVPVAGVFNGLFFEPDQLNAAHSGFFTLKLKNDGRYNATLSSPGKKYSMRGRFGSDGLATNRIARANADPLTVIWEASLNDADVMGGSVSDGEWTAPLLGDRAVFNTANPAPQAGRYTLIIPGTPGATEFPAGDGYATAVVDAKGVVHLKGRLADGRPLLQNVAISKNGAWPLYVSLYNGGGVLLGWLYFGDDGANDLSGRLRWIKPARPGTHYPAGFAIETDAIGSRYAAPTGANSVLQITDGLVILNGGNLPESTNPVTFGPNSRLVNNGPNALKLNFVPATGVFGGTFKEAGGNRTFPIKGVVLQRQNFGAGYAPGASESGRVVFEAAP